MKKIIFIPFIILSFIGCSSDLTIKQSTNNGNSSSSNNGSVQLPTESIIDISSGSVASDTPAPENASLYTISSHIPQTPTYDTNTVNYSLTGIYNSPNVSMKAFIENSAVNKNINNDNDTMRYIIKQQIDFNNTAKANNYKPITENDNIKFAISLGPTFRIREGITYNNVRLNYVSDWVLLNENDEWNLVAKGTDENGNKVELSLYTEKHLFKKIVLDYKGKIYIAYNSAKYKVADGYFYFYHYRG